MGTSFSFLVIITAMEFLILQEDLTELMRKFLLLESNKQINTKEISKVTYCIHISSHISSIDLLEFTKCAISINAVLHCS